MPVSQRFGNESFNFLYCRATKLSAPMAALTAGPLRHLPDALLQLVVDFVPPGDALAVALACTPLRDLVLQRFPTPQPGLRFILFQFNNFTAVAHTRGK